MVSGPWIYKQIRDHQEYYELVPLRVTVMNDDPPLAIEGSVYDFSFPALYFRTESGDEYKLALRASKTMNKLFKVVDGGGDIQRVSTRNTVTLTPVEEVEA